MRHVVQPVWPGRFRARYMRNSLQAQVRAFWIDSRTQHETLPEEQLRRDEHKTYRVRKHGNHELPLPPLLDPAIHRERMRYTRLEQRQKEDVPKTSLEDEIASNPHAQALLGPIRQCRITRVTLPMHFLKRLDPILIHNPAGGKVTHLVSEEGAKQRPCPKIESVYVMNKASVFKHLAKPGSTQVITSPHAAEQVAILLQRGDPNASMDEKSTAPAAEQAGAPPSHQSLNTKQSSTSGSEDRGAILEKMLLEKSQELFGALRRSHTLCLKQDEALRQLDKIVAFVRPGAAAVGLESIRGKPCYALPIRPNSTKPDVHGGGSSEEHPVSEAVTSPDEVVGIVRHKKTFVLMLALDRLFSYKELYHG